MTYLGLRNAHSGSGILQDELRVLQQVNGGENLCVFKGLVTPGGKGLGLTCEIQHCVSRPVLSSTPRLILWSAIIVFKGFGFFCGSV